MKNVAASPLTYLWTLGAAACAVVAEDKAVASFQLAAGTNPPNHIVFSGDINRLAAMRPSGTVEIWDVGMGTRVAEWQGALPQPEEAAGMFATPRLAILPGTNALLIAAGTNVAVHELQTGKLIRELEPAPKTILGVALSPNGARVVGLTHPPASRFELVFWNMADGKILSRLPTKAAPWEMPAYPASPLATRAPASIRPGVSRAFSADASLFAIGLEYGQVHLWNLEAGKYIQTLRAPGELALSSSWRVERMVFLNDEKLAAVCNRSALVVFELKTDATETLVSGFPSPGSPDSLEIRGLATSGDGQRLAVAGMRRAKRKGILGADGDFDVPQYAEVQVWDAVAIKPLATFVGKPSDKFEQVVLDDSGQKVAAVTIGVHYNSSMFEAMQFYRTNSALAVHAVFACGRCRARPTAKPRKEDQ